MDILEATDGEEALKRIETSSPDIILMAYGPQIARGKRTRTD
jgi:hypothetical protein